MGKSKTADPEDWNQYRTFLAFARGGTLAAAAGRLGSSISTVHRHLAQLEETLGSRLFERRGRGQVLTPVGEALLARAERVEAEIVAIEREVAGRDATLRGTVVLTTTDTVAHRLLSRYIPAFRERLPEVHLQLHVDNRQYRLGRGEADVALRPGRRPTEPDVVATEVGSATFAWYAATEYLERRGRPRRKRDLMNHDAIVPDASLANVIYGRVAAELTDPARWVLRAPSLLVQAMAVEAGAGVAALPCFLMDRRPGIERLFQPEIESPLWLLYHADLRHTARVRAVVDLLAESLAADRAVLEGTA